MASVIVSCKTPNGFIMEVDQKKVKINGYNAEDGLLVYERGHAIGITYDVDESFFDKWAEQHKDHPLLNKEAPFVWKTKSEANAKAQAKDTKSVKTGLEQKTKAELDKVAGAVENKEDF